MYAWLASGVTGNAQSADVANFIQDGANEGSNLVLKYYLSFIIILTSYHNAVHTYIYLLGYHLK